MCACYERYNICLWIYNYFNKPPQSLANQKPTLFLDEERGMVYYYNLPNAYLDD